MSSEVTGSMLAASETDFIDVLLVDDQRIVGEAVRRLLAPNPRIRLHMEQLPERAVERAVEVGALVVLQDLIMPGVDGLDLVVAYRADPRTENVPLVVLSSRDEPATKAEAFARGANDYLVKLPSGPELIARVTYHARGFLAQRERDQAFAALEVSQRQLAARNELILRVFGRYVDEGVVTSILESPEALALGGARRELSVLMADMRGFTRLSDDLAPEQVVRMLNNFLEVLIDVVLEWGGTIDNIVGDGLFVLFGAPVAMPDHAYRAVRCALAMQDAIGEVNRRNGADALPEVAMGVGVHSGEVVAGNIGSQRRTKYSVIGRNVNLAARIQGYTAGGQVFVSDVTRRAFGDGLDVDASFTVQPKGFRDSFEVFPVLGCREHPRLATVVGDAAVPLREVARLGASVQRFEEKRAVGEAIAGELVAVAENIAVVELAHSDWDAQGEVLVTLGSSGDDVSFYAIVAGFEAAEGGLGRLRLRVTDASGAARDRLWPQNSAQM
jgi:adenylate cyclase